MTTTVAASARSERLLNKEGVDVHTSTPFLFILPCYHRPIMHRSFGREVALILFKAFVVIASIVAIIVALTALYETELSISDGTCNVAVIPIEGEIWPFYALSYVPGVITPEMVETSMRQAEEDTAIEAVLVEINSPGGLPVASERIAERLRSSTLPVVGMIGDMGASGGYMIAAAADHLIASPMSMVGSIGVTMSYLEYSQQNEDSGIEYVELNSGEFKNAGDPNKPLTEEEREVFQRDLDDLHNEFVTLVSRYRDIPKEKVAELADGSTMNGNRALEVGLVDGLGARKEAREALATILAKDISEIIFCEYESSLIPF
jgi:protease IV